MKGELVRTLNVRFDAAWVLSHVHAESLPVERLLSALNEAYRIEVLSRSSERFSVRITDADAGREAIDALIVATFGDAVRGKYEFDLSEPQISDEPGEASSAVEGVMEKIRALIGAPEFIALCEECVRVAPGFISRGLFAPFTHRAYLFSLGQGRGMSTYLALFAELLSALGLFGSDKGARVREYKLPVAEGKDAERGALGGVLELLSSLHAQPTLLALDISEWMTKTDEKSFHEFLLALEDHLGDAIFVFRVPFVEKDVLYDLKKSLSDVLFVREVSFAPLDAEELRLCAEDMLAECGYRVSEDAWEIFSARIAEEKTDGRFYGINTVQKVIREMLYLKQLHNSSAGTEDDLLKKEEILPLVSVWEDEGLSGLAELESYVGMEPIARRVEEIVAQIELAMRDRDLEQPCIHMRFIGNPGTGKTTAARLTARILKERGVLRQGSFFEHTGRDLCGRYVGETAPKTAAICRDAYGSVLFIDEAYSLYRDARAASGDFGREAIDTLIAEMENHRNDLVVIMAGYPEEMEELMRANPGLESRMPYVVEFENYSRGELSEIYLRMASRAFLLEEGFVEAVRRYFDSLPEEQLCAKNFSNARFVRNLFERTWGKALLRCQLAKSETITLKKEDLLLAASEKEFSKLQEKPRRKLGFS